MSYVAQQVFNMDDVYRELQRIQGALDEGEFESIRFHNEQSAPLKPQEERLYKADGTNWNPGAGEGLYLYRDSGYYKLLDIPSAGVYGDYLVGGFALGTGASAPTTTNFRDGLYLPAFAGTGATTEQAFFTMHILHDIKPGTDLTFHIHWTHNVASPTGNVKWQIEYSIANGYLNESYPASTTLSTTQTAGAQYGHHITTDDDMTISSTELEPDAVIIGRVFRDPTDVADTFANPAFLIQVDAHYTLDRLGTAERNRPFNGY